MSQEETSTPETQSCAFKQARAYAEEKVSLAWVVRICRQSMRTATPQVGAISLIPYAYMRRHGKDDPWPQKAVYVDVVMSRVVEGEYSRIPLHMIVEAGRAVGVPFKEWQPESKMLQVESLSARQPAANLPALDQRWAMAATEQGVVKNLGSQLSPDVYRALRRDYVHHSARNQGIANPANTNQRETSVSKERRHIIGNQEV